MQAVARRNVQRSRNNNNSQNNNSNAQNTRRRQNVIPTVNNTNIGRYNYEWQDAVEAIQYNEFDAFRAIIEEHPILLKKRIDDFTLLDHAFESLVVSSDTNKFVKFMLDKGALLEKDHIFFLDDVDIVKSFVQKYPGVLKAVDRQGRTPFHVACGDNRDNIEMLEYYLMKGANVNGAPNAKDTPLTTACENVSTKVARFLLERGADVDAKGKASAPLHRAAWFHKPDNIKVLLEFGANIERKDNQGRTPLMTAMFGGSSNCVKALILGGANIEAKNSNGLTPIMCLDYFQLSPQQDQNEKAKGVRALIEAGANLEARSANGRTPLMHACYYDSHYTTSHVASQKIIGTPIINVMLEYGADVNAKDNDGNTALMHAVFMRNLAAIFALMRAGSDPRAENNDGETALDAMERVWNANTRQVVFKALDLNIKRKPVYNSLRKGNAVVNANTEFIGSNVMAINNAEQVRKGDFFYNTGNVIGNKVTRAFHKDLLEQYRNSKVEAKNPITRRPWPINKAAEIGQVLKKVQNNTVALPPSQDQQVVGGAAGAARSKAGRGGSGAQTKRKTQI
jgi:ankyrin repeat protein